MISEQQERLEKIAIGICPECNRKVLKDWKPPTGTFAPEMWATLREKNINPATGHYNGCKYDV